MRIPITFDKPLGVMFDEIPKESFRRRALSVLKESFIIEDKRSLKEAIATSTNSSIKSMLSDVMNTNLLCWSSRGRDQEAIHVDCDAVNLDEALADLQKQIDLNKTPIKSGTRREIGFDQKFKLALRHAKRIEIIDPYASSNLASLSAGPVWFLCKLIENFDGVISIYSSEPRDGSNLPAGIAAKRQILSQNIDQILKDLHGFKGDLRLNMSNEVSDIHNRKIAMRFDAGQATLVLEKGLAIFDSDPLKESWELANADIYEYKNIIQKASSSRSLFEIVRSHADVCESCPI